MGIYYSPAGIEKHGTRLTIRPGVAVPETFADASKFAIIAIVDSGADRIAPDVTDSYDMQRFYKAHLSGYYLTFKLFAVSRDKLELCPNQGAEPSTYADEISHN